MYATTAILPNLQIALTISEPWTVEKLKVMVESRVRCNLDIKRRYKISISFIKRDRCVVIGALKERNLNPKLDEDR